MGFAAFAFSAAVSISASRKQSKAQKAIQRENKKLADIKATRERRRLARESRLAQANISVATEGGAGSRAAGVGGSVVTKAASAAGFAGQQQQIGESIFQQGLIATSAREQGQIASSVSSLTSTSYNIFKDNQQKET